MEAGVVVKKGCVGHECQGVSPLKVAGGELSGVLKGDPDEGGDGDGGDGFGAVIEEFEMGEAKIGEEVDEE